MITERAKVMLFFLLLSSQARAQNDATTFTKLFVATGATARSFNDASPELLDDVEIVDLTELDHACLKPKPFPKAMTGAVGAYIDGAPLVCGGLYEDERDKCYRYEIDSDEWELQDYSMTFMRIGASATKVPDQDRWVVSGGSPTEEVQLISEELENNDFTLSFPLPLAVNRHALLALGDDTFFLVGGVPSEADQDLSNTWIYNYLGNGLDWSPFAPTTYEHQSVMAGVTVTLDGVQEVVATGGEAYVTEIFDLEGLRWREGPEFPGHVVEGAYTQYANSFIIVGGVDPETGGNDKYGDQIYLYDPDNEVWVHFAQKLQTPRTNAVAFLVPDEFCPGGHEP